ncbi:MAG: polysaccharide deacetylase family protein [Candidatus Zixiibacteriota bacterium]
MYTILTYHTVGNYEEILPAGINTPIEVFRSHMDYLFHHQYRVVPLDQMVNHIINSQELNNRTLAITFDDGYEDHFLYAYPILNKYGFSATIFVTVKYIDGYWESEKAEEGRIKALSRDQILEMQNGGLIQFGSHGYSHNNLLSANEGEKVFEIRESKSYLGDLLGRDIPFISYPFGACDGEIKKIVRKVGYRAGFSVWSRKPDIYSIRRIPLHTRDDLKRFRFKLSPLYSVTKSLFKLST